MSIVTDPGLILDGEALAKFTRELPESDGVPLESAWERDETDLLIDVSTTRWSERDDFYVGGNAFVYYGISEARKPLAVGPDFYYVEGVDRFRPRNFWTAWVEGGKLPDLVIEYLSPSTRKFDLGGKKTLYERTLQTREYFCYDPDATQLFGWRLKGSRYQKIKPDERGWMWSDVFQLWLGIWTGEFLGKRDTWLRLFDKDGRMLPTHSEQEAAKAQAEAARADTQAARAQAEATRAQAEATRAQAEAARAQAAIERAEAAEQEIARLREQLASQQGPKHEP